MAISLKVREEGCGGGYCEAEGAEKHVAKGLWDVKAAEGTGGGKGYRGQELPAGESVVPCATGAKML